jgi:hypothetical protein
MAINFHKKIRVKNISNLEPEQASEYHGNHGRHRGGHHKGHHRHH